MAQLNPAGLFPNMNIDLPAPIAGEMQWRMANEGLNQAAMQSRLGQLEEQRQRMLVEEQQANLPVKALERELLVGQHRGALSRQPFELAIAQDDAEFKASPTFREVTKRVQLGAENEKARMQTFKKNADEMDIYAQAIGPVVERLRAGDVTGANDAWAEAGVLLDKHGVDTKALQKVPMDQLTQRYEQAIKTAPILRKQYEQWEEHERAKELEILKYRAKVAAAKAGVDDKPPATPNAVVARIHEKYRKDPASVTDPEISLFREALETNVLKNSEDLEDNLWNDASRQVAAEDKARGVEVKSNRGSRIRAKYNEMRKKFFDQVMIERYPELAKRSGVANTAPSKEDKVIDFSQLNKQSQR